MTSASIAHSATIALQNVSLTLGKGSSAVEVLKNVDLNIEAGSSNALLGPSGSGKSTLLMVMTGLEQVNAGQVLIAGRDIAPLSEDDLARFRRAELGIVFQSFHLIPTMTALENVAVPLELAGNRDAFAKAAEALERAGLGARKSHYPAQLSGGEQQRVAIARAIAPEPRFLFADEPTGNLDAANGALITDLLFNLQKELGSTLILVTHDAALAQKVDTVFTMVDGKPVKQKPLQGQSL